VPVPRSRATAMADSAADIEAHEGDGPSSGMQTAKDLFSGAAGGIAQVLIGTLVPHPLSPSRSRPRPVPVPVPPPPS
jgi:hypothetical protein